jgi:hypothetical protein
MNLNRTYRRERIELLAYRRRALRQRKTLSVIRQDGRVPYRTTLHISLDFASGAVTRLAYAGIRLCPSFIGRYAIAREVLGVSLDQRCPADQTIGNRSDLAFEDQNNF